MEDWEVHFREKSSRRARVRVTEDRMKVGALALLIAGIVAAGWLVVFGAR